MEDEAQADQSEISLKRPHQEISEEESSSDESDVEFILAPRPGTAAAAASRAAIQIEPPSATTATAQPGLRQPEAAVQAPSQPKPKVPGVDVDAVANYDGTPITQLDLNQFDDKPWRKPGADITDYFNYGFDEFTWTAYCSKQDHMRTTYTPQKVMAQMGMPPMFMPGMMPPGMKMPGMP